MESFRYKRQGYSRLFTLYRVAVWRTANVTMLLKAFYNRCGSLHELLEALDACLTQTALETDNLNKLTKLPYCSPIQPIKMTTTETTKKIHQGRNIKRFREMFGMKQEALAIELGEDWSQKKVSRLEEHEQIEDDILQQVAKILKVPVEAIKNFDEQAAVQVISNTFSSHENSTLNAVNYNCTFNPIDKLLDVIEENKRLYERLLAAEKEKNELLQRLLDRK